MNDGNEKEKVNEVKNCGAWEAQRAATNTGSQAQHTQYRQCWLTTDTAEGEVRLLSVTLSQSMVAVPGEWGGSNRIHGPIITLR